LRRRNPDGQDFSREEPVAAVEFDLREAAEGDLVVVEILEVFLAAKGDV
jgi:hypothetical protein